MHTLETSLQLPTQDWLLVRLALALPLILLVVNGLLTSLALSLQYLGCYWYANKNHLFCNQKLTSNQAAPKYNYGAICAIYFLASLGLGGNIPIDATIALEFLPHNRRFLVALLSMWQPIGVAIASCIAYGTTGQAKWRCDPDLPACPSVNSGEACCTVDSNMGWRYTVIVLGCMTLAVFFLRYFVFTFHESPKFLLARGKEQEALDVLHRIAKFNKQPAPTLTMEMFAAIDDASSNATSSVRVSDEGPQDTKTTTKKVVSGFGKELTRLKGIFTNKLSAFIFVLLAITYMVSIITRRNSGIC